MKKLISIFSDKLLTKQQLKTVKGGTPYCFCDGSPVNCGPGSPPGSESCPGDNHGGGGIDPCPPIPGRGTGC